MRIWCDFQGVVNGLKGLLCGTRRVRSSGKHADLWLTIVDLIADVRRDNISITKVAAHQDVSSTVCGFEEWCFLHNCLADSAAQLANTQRSLAFWKAHTKFKQQIDTLLSISRAVLYQQHADQTAGIDAEIEPDISQSAVACPTPWLGIPEVAGCPGIWLTDLGYGLSRQFVTRSLMFFTSPMLQIRDSTSTSCKARETVARFTSPHGRIQLIGHKFHCLGLVSRSNAAGGCMLSIR